MPYICVTSPRNHSPLYFVQYLFIYIFHLTENWGCHDGTVTDSDNQSQARIGVLVYRIVWNTIVISTSELL